MVRARDLDSGSVLPQFGWAVTYYMYFEGDSTHVILVSSVSESDEHDGAVYVIQLSRDGEVRYVTVIMEGSGGFDASTMGETSAFGCSLAVLDDYDGNEFPEIAVGDCRYDKEILQNVGAVWILWMDKVSGGIGVVSQSKITTGESKFDFVLNQNDYFGSSLTAIDLRGDGTKDLIVGASGLDYQEEIDTGAVFILDIDANGEVVQWEIFSQGAAFENFGTSLVVYDEQQRLILVGTPGRATTPGTVRFLKINYGSIEEESIIYGFNQDDKFGASLCVVDTDGDGKKEIMIGSFERGIYWLYEVVENNTAIQIVEYDGRQNPIIEISTQQPSGFGASVAHIGDIDSDGGEDFIFGFPGMDTPIIGIVSMAPASCVVGSAGPDCSIDCPDCTHGNCLDGLFGNGLCDCDPYWTGDLCDECTPNRAGTSCDIVCDNCVHGTCNNGTEGNGNCICDENFALPLCDDCVNGNAGPDCSINCPDCDMGSCDQGIDGTGTCLCENNFNGTLCNECKDGYYDETCVICPKCENGDCSDGKTGTGECKCFPNWKGDLCQECIDNFYGEACAECKDCGNGKCNDSRSGDGLCTCNVNWFGDICDDCTNGMWGDDCTLFCPLCINGFCDDGINGNGTCTCNVGAYGPLCGSCESGYFGSQCKACPLCVQGQGTCNEGSSGNGKCSCVPEFAGVLCAENNLCFGRLCTQNSDGNEELQLEDAEQIDITSETVAVASIKVNGTLNLQGNSHLTVTENMNVTNSLILNGSSLSILGNISFTSTSNTQISGTSTIAVSGCANFGGKLQLGALFTTEVISYDCKNGEFDSITIEGCETNPTAQYAPTGLSLTFGIGVTDCPSNPEEISSTLTLLPSLLLLSSFLL